MKVAIINFPGINCERDTQYAFEKLGCQTQIIWHKETTINADLVVLPGGFSYGDYLRTAAIAKFSPIMKTIVDRANSGGLTLGICNGFQMLLELGLLEGAMLKNKSMSFIAKFAHVKVINNDNKFTSKLAVGDILNLPVAHGEGNYFVTPEILEKMNQNGQILLKYCDEFGNESDINGSIEQIAGICNENKNVFGLMPHPERAIESLLGSKDGKKLLEGLVC